MNRSRAIIKYKQKLMSKIVNNKAIIGLVDKEYINSADELIGKNLFNYIRIPNTEEEEKTYICLEVDIPEVYSDENYMFGKLEIIVYIITHQNLMDTNQGALRTDLISAYIDEMFNLKKIVGLKPLELICNVSGAVTGTTYHRCRIMKFYGEDWTLDKCNDTEIED